MNAQSSFDEISKKFFQTLKNTETENKQLIIAFSGIPGVGKSELARRLEERYRAVRIGNDSIRNIISSSETFSVSAEEAEILLQNYNEHFIRNYPFGNRFLVLDKSMDRQYKRFFPIFEELGLRYFIIRMHISPEEAIERILKREEIDPAWLQANMERWQREFKDFGKNSRYDLLLDGLNPNYEMVHKRIDGLIHP
jgi:dephospho-CoA kinase